MEEKVTMSIRPATEADVEKIVELHQQAFDGFFLSKMHSSFLYQYYYRAITEDVNSYVLLCEGVEAELQGFVVGFDDVDVFYRQLKKSWSSFIVPLGLSVCQPQLVRLIAEKIFSMLFRNKVNSNFSAPVGYNELTSIAVSEEAKGLGVASKLMSEYIDIVSRGGVSVGSICLLIKIVMIVR